MQSNMPVEMNFLSEMAEYQITAHEFFSRVLLDILERNFHYENVLISYFDTQGKFLSWTSKAMIMMDAENHPYRNFQKNDPIRKKIFYEAVQDSLTYDNVLPRLYKATDILPEQGYATCEYVRFIEKNFGAHYSVSLAFGINAYIQVTFFKTAQQGDFDREELEKLEQIYRYIAAAYRNFKRVEKPKIVAEIQQNIIETGEKAYLITDENARVISWSTPAQQLLRHTLGLELDGRLDDPQKFSWLIFLLSMEEGGSQAEIRKRTVKNCIFTIRPHTHVYSNGIAETYYWITMKEQQTDTGFGKVPTENILSPSERRIAESMGQGMTYQEIALQLFISYHTVKNHVQNIYKKCGVKNRVQLLRWLEGQA